MRWGTPRLRGRVKTMLRTSVRGKYLDIKRHVTMHKHNTCIHIYPEPNLSSNPNPDIDPNVEPLTLILTVTLYPLL